MATILNVEDLRRLARRRLPRMFYDFVDGGSWDEVTYRANQDDFSTLRFRQRVGLNIDGRSMHTRLVGQPVSMPLALAPTGLAGLLWPDGEIAAACAAKTLGVPFTLSTMSMASIEDIAELTDGHRFWFQRDDVQWIRKIWDGKLILKGIMDADDACRALATGADALIVSNHGGRQLDGAPSAIQALSSIVDAVGDRIEVHMDGGIRTGQDVLKALAVGAKGCYVGRAWLYGLAARGRAGVEQAIGFIRKELDLSMAFCGCREVSAVDPRILASSLNEVDRSRGGSAHLGASGEHSK
jgi:isopentenyl diphosphate isomerase/L-lactate dehydrogenase-like FMN-dependent dehydrogenase